MAGFLGATFLVFTCTLCDVSREDRRLTLWQPVTIFKRTVGVTGLMLCGTAFNALDTINKPDGMKLLY